MCTCIHTDVDKRRGETEGFLSSHWVKGGAKFYSSRDFQCLAQGLILSKKMGSNVWHFVCVLMKDTGVFTLPSQCGHFLHKEKRSGLLFC